MKKILALVLAMILALGMVAALADTKITINRDSATWNNPKATSKKADYTLYKIFDAQIVSAASVTPETGALSGDGTVVYTISGTNAAAKVAALPTIFKVNGETPSSTVAAANDGKYYITLASTSTTAAEIVAALKTLVTGNPTLFPADANSVTGSEANPVVISPAGGDGYYLIVASNGEDLAVQTIGDITINEKNQYPTIDKKQRKANGEFADAALPQEIGKYIDYKVDVTVPSDANKAIYVYDKMSAGLTFDATEFDKTETKVDGLIVKQGTNDVEYTAVTSADSTHYNSEATWQIVFSAETVEANQGNVITITYRALVTEAALTDSGKENEVTLKYDENNYIVVDKVNYEFYTTGAVKYDGATADVNANNALEAKEGKSIAYLQGAEFKLQVQVGKTGNYVDLAVVKNSDDTYRPAKSGETGVAIVSNANGEIIIRGLDKDNNYQLIETKQPDGGYNLLSNSVALNVTTKDAKDKVALKPASGSSPADDTTYLDNATAELSAKIANNKGAQLPSTGGIGTTIFYVAGSVLVLAAAILLITKRRMGSND